jgi:pilus assembly protein Flp/PilA
MKSEEGATAIEYGLIASLIAVAIVTALTLLGGKLSNVFTTIQSSL